MPKNKRRERSGENIEHTAVVEVLPNTFIVHRYIKSKKSGKWKGM